MEPRARGDASKSSEANDAKPEHLLALKGVSKSFGPVQALTEVDFEVDAGEVVALVGDNGAGKSTLVKAMDGVQPADSGEMYFEGRKVRLSEPKAAAKLGITTVHQDLALCDNLDVVANLFLGQEEVGGDGVPVPVHTLDETDMEQRTLQLLDDLSVTTLGSVRTAVGNLSGGQRQSVAIARSLVGDPKVVLLDEPTAALGVSQTEQVLALEKRLAERGLGVVVISHNLGNVFQVADRIVVLLLGRRVATFKADQTTPEEVVAAITGASADTAEREGQV
jgi:D-xylose transport system ATP-binding protein